jgi:hypothetical protein
MNQLILKLRFALNNTIMSEAEQSKPVKLRTQGKFAELADDFIKSYSLISVIAPSQSNKRQLKKPTDRVCRFCGRKKPEVTFNNNAHLIPQFLGNNALFSDFECDSCNSIFSKYENQLANLVGAERTLNKVKGKTGIPKFKSPSGKVEISVEDFYQKESIQISRPVTNKSAFKYDNETSTLTVSFSKNSYIPNQAYKCLQKIALSVLSNEESVKYDQLKRYIVESGYGVLNGCPVFKYILPFGINLDPHVLVFKKLTAAEYTFTHMIGLFCLNYIFWTPVMLNKDDLHLYNIKTFIKIPPPLFLQPGDIEKLEILQVREDWSSTVLKKGETQSFAISINKSDLDNAIGIDPITGERTKQGKFDENDMISLIILRQDDGPINFIPKQTSDD